MTLRSLMFLLVGVGLTACTPSPAPTPTVVAPPVASEYPIAEGSVSADAPWKPTSPSAVSPGQPHWSCRVWAKDEAQKKRQALVFQAGSSDLAQRGITVLADGALTFAAPTAQAAERTIQEGYASPVPLSVACSPWIEPNTPGEASMLAAGAWTPQPVGLKAVSGKTTRWQCDAWQGAAGDPKRTPLRFVVPGSVMRYGVYPGIRGGLGVRAGSLPQAQALVFSLYTQDTPWSLSCAPAPGKPGSVPAKPLPTSRSPLKPSP